VSRWAALAALLLCCATPASADEGLRVLLMRPEDRELVTRVEGQTRDLGIRLEVQGTRETADSLLDPVAIAALARARGARFVVQVERVPQGGLEVRVYDARRRSLRRRSVPARANGERFASSAELEAAALVLRGELSELIHADVEPEPPTAAGSTAAGSRGGGVDTGGAAATASAGSRNTPTPATPRADNDAGAQPEPGPEPEPEPEDEDDSEDAAPPDAPGEALASRRDLWTLRAAARGSIPVRGHVAPGVVIGLRAPLDWLELGVQASSSLPLVLSSARDGIEIELWRHALAAEALATLPLTRHLRLVLGVQAGIVLYARSTGPVALPLEATGSRLSWNATLGAQAELQWLLARPFGVALALGADGVLPRTRFAYEPADLLAQPREIAALGPVEPWATAGFLWLFR
jgi:hypothetical protein